MIQRQPSEPPSGGSLTRVGFQIASRRIALADPLLAVRVLEAGEGPPLLLVHGSGMTASTWAPLMPHLAGYRLIAPTYQVSVQRRA